MNFRSTKFNLFSKKCFIFGHLSRKPYRGLNTYSAFYITVSPFARIMLLKVPTNMIFRTLQFDFVYQ